jgi:hypothetical protein
MDPKEQVQISAYFKSMNLHDLYNVQDEVSKAISHHLAPGLNPTPAETCPPYPHPINECGQAVTGQTHQFASGARSSGKLPRYDLIPWDVFSKRLADRYALGLQKYSEDNYERGINDREFVLDRANHMLEHAHKAVNALRKDLISVDDDLAAVLWGAIFLMLVQTKGGAWPMPDKLAKHGAAYGASDETIRKMQERARSGAVNIGGLGGTPDNDPRR